MDTESASSENTLCHAGQWSHAITGEGDEANRRGHARARAGRPHVARRRLLAERVAELAQLAGDNG